MRLLHARTRQLEEFEDDIGIKQQYAILSHTWEGGEVSFDDIQNLSRAEKKPGYHKIDLTCRQAIIHGLEYVWIDTCCIDKSSSAELSAAVNTMFGWYKNSSICYVYLSDVLSDVLSDCEDVSYPGLSFVKSRWFTRGWTLQELIAPLHVQFYSSDWIYIGEKSFQQYETDELEPDKYDLCMVLEEITSIPPYILQNPEYLDTVSVAKKMSWTSYRRTTRIEDQAYCLLGLFDVSLPMVYGEGAKAFQRLQEAILRSSTDHSILAWSSKGIIHGVLAESPHDFRKAGKVVRYTPRADMLDPFAMTNAGLRINLPIVYRGDKIFMLLNARYEDDFKALLGVRVDIIEGAQAGDGAASQGETALTRVQGLGEEALKVFDLDKVQDARKTSILLAPSEYAVEEEPAIIANGVKILLQLENRCFEDLWVVKALPQTRWNHQTQVFSWPGSLGRSESIAGLVLGYPFIPEELPAGPSAPYGYYSSRDAEIYAKKRSFKQCFVILVIRVSYWNGQNQICAFNATVSTKSPDQLEMDNLMRGNEAGWTKVTNDELDEEHEVSSFEMEGGYTTRVTVCREVHASLPVYVVNLASVEGLGAEDSTMSFSPSCGDES